MQIRASGVGQVGGRGWGLGQVQAGVGAGASWGAGWVCGGSN